MTASVELTQLIGGLDFGEGPRWRDDRLWYSDFYQHTVYTVTMDGERSAVFSLDDQPSGLGWLPNGDLLCVAMISQTLVRWDGHQIHPYADLSSLAAAKCNDMVVAADGTAYVGNFGFDLENQAPFAPATLIGVRPDRTIFAAAEGLAFPNGAVITPDDTTLIIGETGSGNYKAYTINDDGSLSDERIWAELGGGFAPDGCALDADGGIWFSDAAGHRVVRVVEGGEITHEVATPQPTFACALGGPDRRTLLILTSPGSHPDEVAGTAGGAIWMLPVDSPGVGRP